MNQPEDPTAHPAESEAAGNPYTPPAAATGAESAPRRRFTWWHWLLVFLPGLVSFATTWMLTAASLRENPAGQHDYLLLGTGISGIMAGAVTCVVSGLLLGLTVHWRSRLLACLFWPILCALINLPIAFAGCHIVNGALMSHR